MKIATINLNGIRSAIQKGFIDWAENAELDVICCQEIRIDASTNLSFHPNFQIKNYQGFFLPAEKKGYSGVAIYTRLPVQNVIYGAEFEIMSIEGRYIEIELAHVKIASVYLPSGTSGDARQTIKFDVLEFFYEFLRQKNSSDKPYIICGDFNIAHENIDIKNWKSNQKNSGFLPKERLFITNVINELGYIDTFRYLNPDKVAYTWWSNRANAYANNVGWRIDYQFISKIIAHTLKSDQIYMEQKFSDHAPYIVEYSF